MKKSFLFIFLILFATFSLAITYENQYARLTVTPDIAYSWYGDFWQNYEIENKLASQKCVNVAFLFEKPITQSYASKYSQEAYQETIANYSSNEVCEWVEINQTNECHQETTVNYYNEIRYRTLENDLTHTFNYQQINPVNYGLITDKTHAYYREICLPAYTTVSGRLNYKTKGEGKWDFVAWNTALGIAWELDPWFTSSRYIHDFDNTVDINLTATTLNVDASNNRLKLNLTNVDSTDSSRYEYYNTTPQSDAGIANYYIKPVYLSTETRNVTYYIENFKWNADSLDYPQLFWLNANNVSGGAPGTSPIHCSRVGPTAYTGFRCSNGSSATPILFKTTNNVPYNLTITFKFATNQWKFHVCNNTACSTTDNLGLLSNNVGVGGLNTEGGGYTVSFDKHILWVGDTNDRPKDYNTLQNYLRSVNITSNSSQGNFQSVKLIANDSNNTGGINYDFSCDDGITWADLVNNSYVNCSTSSNKFMYNISLTGTTSYSPYVYDVAFDFMFAPTDTEPPSYTNNATSGSDSTKTGETVYFNVTWFDENPSQYVFCFGDGVSCTNETPQSYSSGQDISLAKTIAAVHNQQVWWQFFAKDAANNWNSTPLASFTIANTPPTQSAPILNSTYGTNFNDEELTCHNISTSDADKEAVTNIYTWFKDGAPRNSLYLPFETSFIDYSGYGNAVTNYGAEIGEGKTGNGSELNGTAYIEVDDSSSIDFSNDKSWELWLKRSDTGAETLFDKSDGNVTNYRLEFDSSNKLKFSYSIPAGAAGNFSWETSTSENFSEGTYSNTVYDTDHVELSSGQSSGSYTSKIFDAAELASWNNMGWGEEVAYREELPDNKGSDSGADMGGNVLLLHMDNDWEDSSGENNDGTANGDATFSASSKFGSHSGSFDGNGDYVSTSTTNFPTGNENITIEAWFKIDDLNSDNNIITYGNSAGHQAIQLFHRTSDDKLVLHYWGGYGAVSAVLNDNTWHHAVAVHVNGNNHLYLDGELAGTTSYANADIVNSFNNIGKIPGFPSYDFDGLIDEVAVFDRALSSTEILEHYKRGILDLDLSVRSCDDAACSGESFTDVADNPPQDLSVGDNQYFQYRFNFTTENTAYSPELSDVAVNYTLFNGEATETSLISNTAITNTAWRHVVVTFDDTGTNNFKLYLDNLLDSYTTETDLPNYKDNDLYIGKNFAGTGFFTGNLDEFRIYNHALSAEQISNNFNLNYNKIISSETTRGETYVCNITPTDGFDDGVGLESNSLTILNSPPTTPSLLNPANGYSSGVLPEFNWTASSDIDPGDTVSYILEISTDSNFAYLNYSNTLTDTKDENVALDSSVIKTYYWRVKATDGIGNSSWSAVRNFIYARWEVTFNVTSYETGFGLSNVNISYCNYTVFNQAGDTTNPYGPYGFPPGKWNCTFRQLYQFPKTKIFIADSDKIIDVVMSESGKLTYEEHTWLEAIYNCIILKDCDLYDLLLTINESAANTWQHIKPTDGSVITSEMEVSNTLNSASNITYDYIINIPVKSGYGLGDYLPVRIGFWFMNETNGSCYSQGTLPTGVTIIEPYCNPLIVQTIGPMGGSVSFRVDLRPNLPAGTYNVKRIIEIDPNEQWEGYGQEVIGTIIVTEDVAEEGVVDLDKTGESMPSSGSSSPSTSGGSGGGSGSGGSSSPITQIYQNITYIINQPGSTGETNEKERLEKEKEVSENALDESEEIAGESGLSAITGAAIKRIKETFSGSSLIAVLIAVITGLLGYIYGIKKRR